jgi:excisionase family DNA binding protein
MAEKFYDVPAASQVLGLKPDTMRRWLRAGRVRGIRLGRDWRISERAIDELAHTATNQPKAAPRVKGNPLAAALALADKLQPAIETGTGGETFSAADLLNEIREERDKDLSSV